MKTNELKIKIRKIWFYVSDIPGWLRLLENVGWKDPIALKYFETIDEEFIDILKKETQYYHDEFSPKIRKQVLEFKEDIRKEHGQKWMDGRKMEFLEGKIKALKNRWNEIIESDSKSREMDTPHWLRKVFREFKGLKRIESQLRRYHIEKYIIKNPSFAKNRVTPEEIASAMKFPFKDLVEAGKNLMTSCPFHEDKHPSFYIKNNYAYCFSCKKSWNTINFIMETKDFRFPEAVRYLLKVKVI